MANLVNPARGCPCLNRVFDALVDLMTFWRSPVLPCWLLTWWPLGGLSQSCYLHLVTFSTMSPGRQSYPSVFELCSYILLMEDCLVSRFAVCIWCIFIMFDSREEIIVCCIEVDFLLCISAERCGMEIYILGNTALFQKIWTCSWSGKEITKGLPFWGKFMASWSSPRNFTVNGQIYSVELLVLISPSFIVCIFLCVRKHNMLLRFIVKKKLF